MSIESLLDEDQGAAPSRIDWRLWRAVAKVALRRRVAALGIVGGGVSIALIEGVRPLLNGALIDEAAANGISSRFMWMAWVWIALCVAFGIGVWCFIAFAGRLATALAFDLREQAFAKLQELPFAWFDRRPTGWLLARLTSDCSKVSGIAPWVLLDLFWANALMLASAGAMLWMRWSLALWVLSVVPLMLVTSVIFTRMMVGSSRRARRANSTITAYYGEAIAGIRTTRSLVRESGAEREFTGLAGELERWSLRNAMQGALYLPVVTTLAAMGAALLLWRAPIVEGLSPGELVAFCQYALLFIYPVQDLAQRFADLLSAQGAAERVQSLVDTVPDIRDSPATASAIASVRAAGGPPQGRAIDGGPDRISHVRFEGVHFEYLPGQPVVQGLELEIRRGETVALVGATGGGKTTIASLMCRFYDVTGGRVLLDGIDIRERSLEWLHTRLGVVQQVPWLFADSIAANIRFGRLDAADDEIREAAVRTGAWKFIEALPQGLGFQVGEGGERLSHGQRQLVSLARAVLADPDILVMDEATSSVDSETERAIQSAIDTVLRDRIGLVIAHRLSTVRRADRILVIDQGRIVECGPHAELVRLPGGRYRALYLEQFVHEREDAYVGAGAASAEGNGTGDRAGVGEGARAGAAGTGPVAQG